MFVQKTEEYKEVVSLNALDDLIAEKLRIHMADSNAHSRIENLFVSYNSLLLLYDLS